MVAPKGFDFDVTESSALLPKTTILTIDEAMDRLGYGWCQTTIFLATGLVMTANSMEVLLLSFLSLALQQTSVWNDCDEGDHTISNTQLSALSASVFAGGIIGALVLGQLADRFGRRIVFVWTTTLLAVLGILSAIAPTFELLLLCRLGVGCFSVGGLAVPFVTLSEFLPSSHRGNNLLLIEFFWTTGSILVVVLAYLTLGQGEDDKSEAVSIAKEGSENYNYTTFTNQNMIDEDINRDEMPFLENWRLFVLLSAVPSVLAMLWAWWFVLESPRWLLTTKNDAMGAMGIIRKVALLNGLDVDSLFPPNTRLQSKFIDVIERKALNSEKKSDFRKKDEIVTTTTSNNESNFTDLLSIQWRKLTLNLWGTWFGFSFLYYGCVIAITMVFANTTNSESSSNINNEDDESFTFDYGALLVSSSAEFVGNVIMVLTVDSLGRIKTQVIAYWMGGLTILLLCLSSDSELGEGIINVRAIMISLAFVTRMLMMISSCTTWVSTAEVLPTHIRATGQSTANAMARLGGFICPFIVGQSFTLVEIGWIMFVVAGFTAYCASNLPETKGQEMGLGIDNDIKERKSIDEDTRRESIEC